MSWYKTSKLIDKKGPEDTASIHSACAYCERWATHDESGETVWKFYDQLPKEDKFFVEQAKKGGLQNERYISHGICPTCWSSMEILNDRHVDAFALPHTFYKQLAAATLEGRAELIQKKINEHVSSVSRTTS